MSGNIMYTKDTWNILMNGMTIFWIPRKNFTRVGWKGIWVHIIKFFEILDYELYRSVAEWFKAAVSKTAEVNSSEGSNPSRPAQKLKCGVMVAQRIYTEWLSEIKLSHNGNIKVQIL